MKFFINGVGLISPQQNTFDETFLNNISGIENKYYQNKELNYKDYLDPLVYRRLSRLIKTNLVSAKMCLKDSLINNPDAIIVGTGLGCIEDTENFLIGMLENNEALLSPTQFMQSTHNTISSQIAILLKCHGYNNTFTHRSFSFEHALLDGCLLLKENRHFNILIGGTDEITEKLYTIIGNIGLTKNNNRYKQIAPGEGSIFFLLSNNQSIKSNAVVRGISTYHKLKGDNLIVESFILEALEQAKINNSEIDLMICGNTGTPRFDKIYSSIADKIFPGATIIPYKYLCGDYFTASAFALALAINIIKYQRIPDGLGSFANNKIINNIIIYNHDKEIDSSLIIVGKC